MVCRGPMPSIISRRCFFSIIFLGDSAPVNSSKELENTIKWDDVYIQKHCSSYCKTNKVTYQNLGMLLLNEDASRSATRCFWNCKYVLKFQWIIKMVAKCNKALNRKAFIESCLTWPNLLSSSYQLAPVSSSLRTAIVTDPITLHLHAVSQSYIVMVTYAESNKTSHLINLYDSGIKYSEKKYIRFRCSQLCFFF